MLSLVVWMESVCDLVPACGGSDYAKRGLLGSVESSLRSCVL